MGVGLVIKEVIVVEGRDDVSAVKQAVDAEVIATHGFSLSKETIKQIKLAQERKGVIILTDPDRAGKLIRRQIKEEVSGCKDAYLSQADASISGDIGVENASPEVIQKALNKAQVERETKELQFTKADLRRLKLLGHPNASKYRQEVGNELGIGYANGKQFLARLNNYGISARELLTAVKKAGVDYQNCKS